MKHVTLTKSLLITGVFVALLIVGCGRMPIPTSPAPGSTAGVASPAAKATVQTPAAAPTLSLAGGQGSAAAGAALFKQQPCSSCHDVSRPFPGGEVGPNLGNIATEAERIVQAPDYHGRATNAAEYIRESIVDPNAYLVPGDRYHTPDGQSVMPKNFGTSLTPAQMDDLVAYLLTLK